MQNKEQYKNITFVPKTMDIKLAVQKYPYCMAFHFVNSVKNNLSDEKSMAAILHPDRTRLAFLYMNPVHSQETIAKEEAGNKQELEEILQQRLAELNKNNGEEKEKHIPEDSLFEPQPSVSLDELVEKFNKFPPSISCNPADFAEEQTYKDLGKSSLQEKTNIVSETLAELYHSQKAYDKALKIYEALMIKYPKKSATFAKLIEKIKEEKKL